MFNYLFSWPDQLVPHDNHSNLVIRSAVHIRLQKFSSAENLLLSLLAQAQNVKNSSSLFDVYLLLFWLFRSQKLFSKAHQILDQLKLISSPDDNSILRLLQIVYWLDTSQSDHLNLLSRSDWHSSSDEFPIMLFYADYLIRARQFHQARNILNTLSAQWSSSLEALVLEARIHQELFDWNQALNILLGCVERFPQNTSLYFSVLTATVEARSHKYAIPVLKTALTIHGEHPEFLSHICRIALLQNRAADSRRYSLMDSLYKRTACIATQSFISNYWVTLDRLGYSNWLTYIYPKDNPFHSFPCEMLEPMISQNASINGSSYIFKLLLDAVFSSYDKLSLSPYVNTSTLTHLSVPTAQSSLSKPLTIAWISSDLNYHPVSRFLFGFFASCSTLNHNHILVDINDHESESQRSNFEALNNLDVLNFGKGDLNRKISNIRSLTADIAIDLNGWTGSNILPGFYSRIAPIQINYLGYFASTGLQSMDYWLGDSSLFPSTNAEWHSETLFPLNRCFIAWQPAHPLPEATIDVIESSPFDGVRFGTFNHIRKLSDPTLKLWGDLLSQVNNSYLVLKANNYDDFSTQELLRRRMLRQGLDVSRVIWLPRAVSAAEHLYQYQHIDIALDCFPNGGCTTTCEALWMGVPVVTLSGNSYVSRMSTAVLNGADLNQYCASSPKDYLRIAISLSDSITWLRSNRDNWRSRLMNNPLGDAADLMHHLESSFSKLSSS